MDEGWKEHGYVGQSQSFTCQSNCADVPNRICGFLSNSVGKFIELYHLKGSYEVILASSASSKVHAQTAEDRGIGLLFHLPLNSARKLVLSSFYHKGGKKWLSRLTIMHIYLERLHWKSLVEKNKELGRWKIWQTLKVTFILPILLTWKLWLRVIFVLWKWANTPSRIWYIILSDATGHL